MSDQTSTLQIKLLAIGQLAALEEAREKSELLKVSVEGLKTVLEAVGVGLSFGALLEFTKSSVELGLSIEKMSAQANISTDAFQRLSYAAIGAGSSSEAMSNALNTLNRNMGLAAEGSTKQQKAIADLGLNTAELLAMPVEEQVEAIARAYNEASDKTRAWADVTALLGKNSADVRKTLDEIGEKGLKVAGDGLLMTKAEIARLDRAENVFSKLLREAKIFTAEAIANPLDTAIAQATNGLSVAVGFHPQRTKDELADQQKGDGAPKPNAAAIQAQMEADVASSAQIIDLNLKIQRALQDTAKAYELPGEAAKRLRKEADEADDRASIFGVNKSDLASMTESKKLTLEAINLRAQARIEDVKAAKDQARENQAAATYDRQMAQEAVASMPIQNQIAQARKNAADIALQLAALDTASPAYTASKNNLLEQQKATLAEINGLEDKAASQAVEKLAQDQELQSKRTAIALAAIEHDYTLTDAQKWDQKRGLIESAVRGQEAFIAHMKVIAEMPGPQGARDAATRHAGQAGNALAGDMEQEGAMGPNPHSYGQQLADGIRSAIPATQTLAQALGKGVGNSITAINNGIHNWITGVSSFRQAAMGAWQNIWQGFATQAEQAFLAMVEKYALNKLKMFAIDEAIAAKGLILSAVSAAKSLIQWIPSAIAASISSYGLAAGIGAAAVLAIVAANKGGFEEGGYTGGTEGNVAGVVHGNEFVWSAPAVRAIGVGNLERAHQAALSGGGGGGGGGGSGGGGSTTHIIALSPEDVARSQRRYVGAIVSRAVGRIPTARVRR